MGLGQGCTGWTHRTDSTCTLRCVHAACACCMCMLHVYTHCIYQAALGPHADRPGATGGGMSTDALVAAWQKPFRPEAEGGCPAQEAATPWFEVKPPMVEALAPL